MLGLTISSVMKGSSTHESTPKASRPGRPRKSVEIKKEASDNDSDDIMNPPEGSSSEEDPSVAKRSSKGQAAKKVLKAVAIPSTTPTASNDGRRRVPSSQSPSSLDSNLSSTRDHSAEYDTPGTSTAVTPAEISMKDVSMISAGKRKRQAMFDVDDDARLAQALQAEEYDDIQVKPIKKSRLSIVNDSDDDDSMLSDLSADESFDNDVNLKVRKSKPAGRAILPSRSAREFAKRTISKLHIEDSEDESVSEFDELNSDDLDDGSESGSDNDEVPTIAAAVASLDSTMQEAEQTAPSNPARRRGRRAGRGNAAAVAERQENWRRRRIAGLNYRVGHIV